jgi:hypothetical protein
MADKNASGLAQLSPKSFTENKNGKDTSKAY